MFNPFRKGAKYSTSQGQQTVTVCKPCGGTGKAVPAAA